MSVKKPSPSRKRPVPVSTKGPDGFVMNFTRRNVLATHGSVLRNPLRQAVGTMFHALPGAYVFVFPWETRVAITNVFVFQSLDILWLDAFGRVTHLREAFPPFAPHAGTPVPARYVIELPAGVIAATGTQRGDQIQVRGLSFTPRTSTVGEGSKPF